MELDQDSKETNPVHSNKSRFTDNGALQRLNGGFLSGDDMAYPNVIPLFHGVENILHTFRLSSAD